MNHIIALLLAGLLCLSASSCGKDTGTPAGKPVNDPEEPEPVAVSQPGIAEVPEPNPVWEVPGIARVSLLQTEYPVGADRMTLVVENTGDQDIRYGSRLSCVKFADGQWREVNLMADIFFADVLYALDPHSTGIMNFSQNSLSQPLEEGLYRLIGEKLWVDQGENTPNWQVDFRVTADALPEPDYALHIPQITTAAETLPVHVINNSGEDGCVLHIPRLERLGENDAWTEVPYLDKVGFCGTPDPFPAGVQDWSEDIAYLWGSLPEGQYRLHYDVGQEFDMNDAAYGVFSVCKPELCGYPLAD